MPVDDVTGKIIDIVRELHRRDLPGCPRKHPTLETGVETMVTAAMAWIAAGK